MPQKTTELGLPLPSSSCQRRRSSKHQRQHRSTKKRDRLIYGQTLARRLGQVEFRIVDLSGDLLGLSYDNVILLDADAAGLGWFLDDSPDTSDDLADGRIDLLTAIAHELGHTLGLSDNLDPLASDIMAARLAAAERRTPSASDADAVMARIGSN